MKHLKFALPVLVISLVLAGCQTTKTPSLLAPTPTPAPQNANISGIVNINGAVVQNSSVLMLQRKAGETEYTEFDRLPAIDGTPFSWTKAIPGQKYDITAAGQVDEKNKVSSNAVTVTAPTDGLVLTLNSKLSLEAPPQTPRSNCTDPDSTGRYNAKITYPSIQNAKQYYVTVGTAPSESNVETKLLPAKSGSDAVFTVYVDKDKDYFTRYAYTYCTDCNQEDQQNWSGFSPTLGFRCP